MSTNTWAFIHTERQNLIIDLEDLRRVAVFSTNSNLLIGAKNRIAALRLMATDTEWVHGSGPEVRGPFLSLIQAMAGQGAALADLTGDVVAPLGSPMPATAS